MWNKKKQTTRKIKKTAKSKNGQLQQEKKLKKAKKKKKSKQTKGELKRAGKGLTVRQQTAGGLETKLE